MRILLLGSNGQLGKELERQVSEIGHLDAFPRSLLDITNYKLVKETVDLINPNIIINANFSTSLDFVIIHKITSVIIIIIAVKKS